MWPDETFYLLAKDEEQLQTLICKTARIGYEQNIAGAMLCPSASTEKEPVLDITAFKTNPGQYTIVDIRNPNEVQDHPVFEGALEIPLPELRERLQELPTQKPVVVHCAAGYRSAAGASIIAQAVPNVIVYDLGEAVTAFK